MSKNYKHVARKRFGQNFLVDTFIIDSIVAALNLQGDDEVVEIGPGQAAITDLIVEQCAKLDLVELDRDLIPILQEKFSTREQVTIHQHDALKFDYKTLYRDKKLRLVGNLPYNISTPLIFHLFDNIDLFLDMHFMLQKEVVERMCASVNSKAYGRLSIMTQYYCDTEMLFEVPPEAFDPRPKVTSAIISLQPRMQREDVDVSLLNKVVTSAFNMRRKNLRNALKTFLQAEDFAHLELNDQARPENLSLDDYIRITQFLQAVKE